MNNSDIGHKVKELRVQNKMTLKELSRQTNLSVGFLSQFERGMTSIAIDSLGKISDIFAVDIGSFFQKNPKDFPCPVMRSYEKESEAISQKIIQHNLSKQIGEFSFMCREFHLMPYSQNDKTSPILYNHEGEEFVYVLTGILTLELGKEIFELYPGDSIEIKSNVDHNWCNNTKEVTKFISINTPNPFKEK